MKSDEWGGWGGEFAGRLTRIKSPIHIWTSNKAPLAKVFLLISAKYKSTVWPLTFPKIESYKIEKSRIQCCVERSANIPATRRVLGDTYGRYGQEGEHRAKEYDAVQSGGLYTWLRETLAVGVCTEGKHHEKDAFT